MARLPIWQHRCHFVSEGNRNWRAFFEAMGDDTPLVPIVDLYRTLWSNPDYECIVLSGRPDSYRDLIERWFVWNDIPFDRIEMCQVDDNRKDHIIKREILEKLRAEGKEIAFCVDDRQSVVDMWRANGVVCLQCDVGDF